MGPRLISRGNSWGTKHNDRKKSFNGAAADQPRKYAPQPAISRRSRRFNGAAADQPRKFEGLRPADRAFLASMGPRLISRGNPRMVVRSAIHESLQWGRG